MKKSSILLSILCALLMSSCEKEAVPPGIIITPNNLIHLADAGSFIEYTINGTAGDASLSSLEITTKPEGGITTSIYEESLSGNASLTTYVFDLSLYPDEEQLLVFILTDEDGLTSQTARRVILNTDDPLLIESTGHNLYANMATGNPNGFNIAGLEPLFLATLTDSLNVDLALLDGTDDDILANIITSYSGVKFTRNNSFNYATARLSTAASSYEASIPLQTISDLEIDDILITKYDTINLLYGAIKIIDIQDMPGTEDDRLIFNVKK